MGTFLVAMLALLVALATILPGAEDDFFATRSGAGFAALAGLTGLAGRAAVFGRLFGGLFLGACLAT